ncbi:Hypothetical protein D9617_17g046600 [Elsinoe fawcettii]|nr:Hypothetical protein D9617_17g046600 [Elsinoe fawcettii]
MSHHDPGDDSSSSDDDIVSPARCSGPATDGGHTNTFTTIGDIANQIGSQHNYGNVSIENGLSQAADAKLSELLEQVKLSRERAERRDRERESRRQQEDKQQILDSLYFPQMFTRRDMLQPAHQETYEWIFREPGNSENNDDVESSDDGEPSDADDSDDLANKDRSRSSFVTWLKESSSDIPFWIQGKPGSGKSVLMRFIERHRSLQSLLQNHVAPQPWKVISFYFWLAGTSAQKSIEGALRTLLFQMLSSHEHMMQMLDLPPRPFEWNRELLWQSIVTLIASAPTKYFILLDGLDESSEDSQALDNFVQQLKSSDQVRLLVSSRSLHNFQLMFAECPTIT